MPRIARRSGNKRWFVTAKPYRSGEQSERGVIYRLVKNHPGITTWKLQESPLVSVPGRIPSRLTELEGLGYLSSQLEADLFAKGGEQ